MKCAASGQNRRSIFGASRKTELFRKHEYETIGLPEGAYSIMAGTRVVRFKIKDGEVTAP